MHCYGAATIKTNKKLVFVKPPDNISLLIEGQILTFSLSLLPVCPPDLPTQGPGRPCKVPPAPPLPLKNSPLEFPQLDLDSSFDFGQLPDLPAIMPGCEDGSLRDTYDSMVDNELSLAENMDVDMDVADWLDSLVGPAMQNGQNNLILGQIQR